MPGAASSEFRAKRGVAAKPVQPGALVYVMGPSGCGKDSLMRYARRALVETDNVAFAHRYITRPPEAGGENHVSLSRREFLARMRMNFFALHWRSHDLFYGIGIEIDAWLSRGWIVVVNGSRAYYSEAKQRYPGLQGVMIEVAPERLAGRLTERGREDPEQVRVRLERNDRIADMDFSDAASIRNDGPLSESGEYFVQCILEAGNGWDA